MKIYKVELTMCDEQDEVTPLGAVIGDAAMVASGAKMLAERAGRLAEEENRLNGGSPAAARAEELPAADKPRRGRPPGSTNRPKPGPVPIEQPVPAAAPASPNNPFAPLTVNN